MRLRKLFASILPGLPAVAVLFLAGCATVAEDYRISDNSTHARGYTSVAGNIEVGRRAVIGNARTVAGHITIGDGSEAGSLTTVAGDVRIAADVKIKGSIKTVAGDITMARGTSVDGDVGTVAGRISATDSVVKGGVTLATGKLDLLRSRVAGPVRIRRSGNEGAESAEVAIGPGSEVAAVVVEEGAVVRLRIHHAAKVGSVKGAVAEYYD